MCSSGAQVDLQLWLNSDEGVYSYTPQKNGDNLTPCSMGINTYNVPLTPEIV